MRPSWVSALLGARALPVYSDRSPVVVACVTSAAKPPSARQPIGPASLRALGSPAPHHVLDQGQAARHVRSRGVGDRPSRQRRRQRQRQRRAFAVGLAPTLPPCSGCSGGGSSSGAGRGARPCVILGRQPPGGALSGPGAFISPPAAVPTRRQAEAGSGCCAAPRRSVQLGNRASSFGRGGPWRCRLAGGCWGGAANMPCGWQEGPLASLQLAGRCFVGLQLPFCLWHGGRAFDSSVSNCCLPVDAVEPPAAPPCPAALHPAVQPGATRGAAAAHPSLFPIHRTKKYAQALHT